jgi:hypothetical protein
MIALAVVTWMFQMVARLLALPFGILNWLLHGLGFLIALPFVLAIMILKVGFTLVTWLVGGVVLLCAGIAFLGAMFLLARGLWGRGHRRVTV